MLLCQGDNAAVIVIHTMRLMHCGEQYLSQQAPLIGASLWECGQRRNNHPWTGICSLWDQHNVQLSHKQKPAKWAYAKQTRIQIPLAPLDAELVTKDKDQLFLLGYT